MEKLIWIVPFVNFVLQFCLRNNSCACACVRACMCVHMCTRIHIHVSM